METDPIFKRTSVRTYSEKPLEKEKIERILRAGMQAPSAGNQQPWEFIVVDDAALLQTLSECSPYAGPTAKAACAIVPLVKSEGLRFPKLTDQDTGACVENMLLEATELGIGSVWQALHPEADRVAKARETLGIPEGLTPFCIIALGYPESGELPAQKSRYDETVIHSNGY